MTPFIVIIEIACTQSELQNYNKKLWASLLKNIVLNPEM